MSSYIYQICSGRLLLIGCMYVVHSRERSSSNMKLFTEATPEKGKTSSQRYQKREKRKNDTNTSVFFGHSFETFAISDFNKLTS